MIDRRLAEVRTRLFALADAQRRPAHVEVRLRIVRVVMQRSPQILRSRRVVAALCIGESAQVEAVLVIRVDLEPPLSGLSGVLPLAHSELGGSRRGPAIRIARVERNRLLRGAQRLLVLSVGRERVGQDHVRHRRPRRRSDRAPGRLERFLFPLEIEKTSSEHELQLSVVRVDRERLAQLFFRAIAAPSLEPHARQVSVCVHFLIPSQLSTSS
jgi:hypothetical protein